MLQAYEAGRATGDERGRSSRQQNISDLLARSWRAHAVRPPPCLEWHFCVQLKASVVELLGHGANGGRRCLDFRLGNPRSYDAVGAEITHR